MSYFDKVDSKFSGFDEADMRATGVRMVLGGDGAPRRLPGARDVVVMPSFVNVGAFVDSRRDGRQLGHRIGSCAQIGKKVHLEHGASIGGVLERSAAGASWTIIEDNCFIGAHSADRRRRRRWKENSVIVMGVQLGSSTKTLDGETGNTSYGRIPSGLGRHPRNPACRPGAAAHRAPVIIKRVDAQTCSKTSINDLLRS